MSSVVRGGTRFVKSIIKSEGSLLCPTPTITIRLQECLLGCNKPGQCACKNEATGECEANTGKRVDLEKVFKEAEATGARVFVVSAKHPDLGFQNVGLTDILTEITWQGNVTLFKAGLRRGCAPTRR